VLRESVFPGAVLNPRSGQPRCAWGTFQYFAARPRYKAHAHFWPNYAIARHYPEAAHAEKALFWLCLRAFITRQAELIGRNGC